MQEFLNALPAKDRTRTGRPRRPLPDLLRHTRFGESPKPLDIELVAAALHVIASLTDGIVAARLAADHTHRMFGPPISRRECASRGLDFTALRSFFLSRIAEYGITIDLLEYERTVADRLERRADPCPALAEAILRLEVLEDRWPSIKEALAETTGTPPLPHGPGA